MFIALLAPMTADNPVSINFPLAFSIIILIAVVFIALPDYFLNKMYRAVKFGSRTVGDEAPPMADWKAGLIHYLIGGLSIPGLFSLFSVYFIKYFYLNLVAGLMEKLGYPLNAPNIEYFNTRSNMTLYAIMILMYYLGIWLGVLFSIIVLNKLHLGNRRWIIVWSVIFMLAGYLFFNALVQMVSPDFLPYDRYNELDQLLRAVFFFIISRKYIYLLLRMPGDRKYIFGIS